jgi:hypothetical protein
MKVSFKNIKISWIYTFENNSKSDKICQLKKSLRIDISGESWAFSKFKSLNINKGFSISVYEIGSYSSSACFSRLNITSGIACMYINLSQKHFTISPHTTQKTHANQNSCDGKASLYTILYYPYVRGGLSYGCQN